MIDKAPRNWPKRLIERSTKVGVVSPELYNVIVVLHETEEEWRWPAPLNAILRYVMPVRRLPGRSPYSEPTLPTYVCTLRSASS
jgi:hypothetical protein